MPKRKILYICHNHPSLYPGGAETYALELYQAVQASDVFEPIFLARIGPTATLRPPRHPGTPFSTINDDPNQYFLYTNTNDFDWLNLTLRAKEIYTLHFREFLLAHRPDIIHFQHTLYLGFDLIRQAKNTLPDTPIVYTLHEYRPICHRDGQMVRTHNQELCHESSPRRCHECFPDITPQAFFSRKRFIQSHLSLVDLFLAPSRFLRDQYVRWGIPAEKIRYEEYGRSLPRPTPQPTTTRPRNRLAFFGQFSPYKGVQVLLKAMLLLNEGRLAASTIPSLMLTPPDASAQNGHARSPAYERGVHLWLHGANLEWQSAAFQQEFETLIEASRPHVTLVGRYDHAELAALMAHIDWVIVPSIWWENSPLVIQEAFAHGRPVICSGIGGMAEKVMHGVNGLHFRADDPRSLAETIRQATSSPGLWETLQSGIPALYPMAEHVTTLSELYQALIDRTAMQRSPICI
jgi:glycosyltransferase involved in cell wall biosynthesis